MPRPAPSPWSPWVLILGIGICTEPVEALKGSLDACSETEVPWSQVQQELLVLQNLVPGSVSEERLHALRELALTGGLDPQECDCWYGWISLRFFIPQVIEVVCATPRSLEKLPGGIEKVDIIVCLFMGYFLMYEARLVELIEARERWLKPGGLMFPDRAKLFVSMVQDGDHKKKHYDFFDDVWGFDFSSVKEAAKADPVVQECDETALVTSSTCILNLDLLRCSVATCYEMSAKFKPRCRHEGSLDAMVCWFEIWFGACHKPISFSTGPESTLTCWKQTLFFLQGTTRRVKAGDEVHCMMAIKKLVEDRRHLDIKIACKVNTGSQQIHYFRWM